MKKRDLAKRLQHAGFVKIRQGRAHEIYRHPYTGIQVTVPRHKEINQNTANKILKDAGL